MYLSESKSKQDAVRLNSDLAALRAEVGRLKKLLGQRPGPREASSAGGPAGNSGLPGVRVADQ